MHTLPTIGDVQDLASSAPMRDGRGALFLVVGLLLAFTRNGFDARRHALSHVEAIT